MSRLDLDPDLYDEEEREMLESFERGEWRSVPNLDAELKRYQKMFRAARITENYGPVPYDVPYPWSKAARAKCGDGVIAAGGAGDDNLLQDNDQSSQEAKSQ